MRFTEGINNIFLRFDGIIKASQGTDAETLKQVMPLSGLMLIISVLSLIILFIYKNRKLQMRLTIILIFLIVAEIIILGYYVFYIANLNAELTFGIKLTFPFLMLISSILAYRYIKKDEELVRSYDRLR